MTYSIAIVGATGNVGQEMLTILAERGFPVSEVVPLASRRSIGREVSFGDETLKVRDLEQHDFSKSDLALFSAKRARATYDRAKTGLERVFAGLIGAFGLRVALG